MLDEALRHAIEDALRQSYQLGNDQFETKKAAHVAAMQYGRKQGLLSDPLTDEEQAALSVAVEMVIRQTPIRELTAILSLEFIGENYFMFKAYKERGKLAVATHGAERYGAFLGRDQSRPWVARITGFDRHYGFERCFIRGQADYSQASNNGARGVFLHFSLRSGVYEVNERISWKNVRRYFLRVEGMQIQEITRKEVEECLSRG